MPASDERPLHAQLRWWAEKCSDVLGICDLGHNDPDPETHKRLASITYGTLSSVSQALRELAERVEREAEEE